MYQYLKHKDIDFNLWDDCINRSENGTFYALSWYLNIVSPKWDGIVYKAENYYFEVFPLPYYKKFGIKILKNPILTFQLGLISNSQKPLNVNEPINMVLRKFRVISNYILNEYCDLNFLGSDNLMIGKSTNYVLNLDRDYGNIYKNYSLNRKRDLKKGITLKLEVILTDNIQNLIKLFSENTADKIYGFMGFEYEYPVLTKIFLECQYRGMGKIYEVISNNETIAAGFFVYYKGRITYLLGTCSKKGREKKAMSFLMDYIIRNSPKHKLLDFAGSNIEGISSFFERFGSKKLEYLTLSINNLPFFLKTIQRIRNIVFGQNKKA